jgi:hypothetical protein
MIDVNEALRAVPPFETFCSVEVLHRLSEELRQDRRFVVEVAGTSRNGVPIYHLKFGAGTVKALLVAGPHCFEPIGSLTVFSLLKLLQSDDSTLTRAGIEWHIVPCSDPDGAILNEGWTQHPFSFERYMKNFYVQSLRDQVDGCFPITYKKLSFTQPSKEATVLKSVLDSVRPDFFFSLHNAWGDGSYYVLTRPIQSEYHTELLALLGRYRIAMQDDFRLNLYPERFAKGIFKTATIRDYYDYLDRTVPDPGRLMLDGGANSWDYLEEIHEGALGFISELAYFRFPRHEAEEDLGIPLRQVMLRREADSKFIATAILEEWENVEGDLDSSSPLYQTVLTELISKKEKLHEGGMPLSRYLTRDILFNPRYQRPATRYDLYHVHLVDGGLYFLRAGYQFVRLLRSSQQSIAVHKASARLESIFDRAFADISREVDLNAVEVIDWGTLAKAQLGAGLIVLNSLLEGAKISEQIK